MDNIKYDLSGEKWKAVEFVENLKVVDYSNTKATAEIILNSIDHNYQYIMFLSDFFDALQNGNVQINNGNAIISGTFKVIKRGTRFGIRLKGLPKYNYNRENRERPISYARYYGYDRDY